MDSRYEAGVSACADYLSNLPERARSIWVDAAYEVWLQNRIAAASEGPTTGTQRATAEPRRTQRESAGVA
jgi:hypothetical protein